MSRWSWFSLVIGWGIASCSLDYLPLGGGSVVPVTPVAHLPERQWRGGTTAVTIDGPATADTDALTLVGAGAKVIPLAKAAPRGKGPDVALLRVGSLTVAAGATLEVKGSAPLIIIATERIDLAGSINASAHHDTPGAGGGAPGQGLGAATAGESTGSCHAGGGGAGYRTMGSWGGSPSPPDFMGQPGKAYGDAALSELRGGSGAGKGGGDRSGCRRPGGAGGGALQLSAGQRIEIRFGGAVLAGGGGGSGGSCPGVPSAGGGGGGSGGAIYLQAPVVVNRGVVAANGGGGGSGREPGGDADLAARNGSATEGGAPGASDGTHISSGASGASDAKPNSAGNACSAGGGGGASGRICIRSETPFVNQGSIGPGPALIPAGTADGGQADQR